MRRPNRRQLRTREERHAAVGPFFFASKGIPMSVALIISTAETDEVLDFTPIATQGSFVRFWLPACRELGLQLIPLLESGMLLTEEALDDFVRELSLLEHAVQQRVDSPECVNMTDRIRTLTTKLLSIKGNRDVKVWIG
jgi:hypothetical protein